MAVASFASGALVATAGNLLAISTGEWIVIGLTAAILVFTVVYTWITWLSRAKPKFGHVAFLNCVVMPGLVVTVDAHVNPVASAFTIRELGCKVAFGWKIWRTFHLAPNDQTARYVGELMSGHQQLKLTFSRPGVSVGDDSPIRIHVWVGLKDGSVWRYRTKRSIGQASGLAP